MATFFRFLLGSSRKSLLLLLLVGAVSGLASAGLISMVSRIFTDAGTLAESELVKTAIIMGGLVFLVLSLELLAKWMLVKHSARRHRDLHILFVHMVLGDPLRKTEKTGMARLITIYSEDMSQIGGALNTASSVGISGFVIAGCLGYLAFLSPVILLSMLVVGIPAAWVYRRLHSHSVGLSRSAFLQRDAHVTHFKNIVQGIKELQLSFRKRHAYVEDEYLPTIHAHEKAFVRSMLMFSLSSAWLQFVYFGLIIAALIFIIVFAVDATILGPFLIVALFMRSYISGILLAVPTWARAGVILQRLSDEGYALIEGNWRWERPKSDLLTSDKPLNIEISGLTYRYTSEMNDKPFTVGPLNLDLSAGELVFLVGHNGAGKTTFAKLLAGLYENESGCIKLNGQLIDDSNRSSYRELFSAIFTDPFVFEHLVVDNELLEIESAENDRILHYLEKLQLHYKVRVDNRRLNTTALSHGQKKRLALLAAYLENKPVLIFDEWAENQDPEFKEVFYGELLPELRDQGKLVFVITHESQYFSYSDRVVTFSAGQPLLDSGTTGSDKGAA